MNKYLYYAASFTWGIIMSVIGAIVFAVLMLCGNKVQQNGLGWRIEIGANWGGFSMGPFALVDKSRGAHVHAHEFGHSIQNCIFGPLMILFVMIPSIIRYWIDYFGMSKTDYEYAWFEWMASLLGERYYK